LDRNKYMFNKKNDEWLSAQLLEELNAIENE
jgi:hypothetical protein